MCDKDTNRLDDEEMEQVAGGLPVVHPKAPCKFCLEINAVGSDGICTKCGKDCK